MLARAICLACSLRICSFYSYFCWKAWAAFGSALEAIWSWAVSMARLSTEAGTGTKSGLPVFCWVAKAVGVWVTGWVCWVGLTAATYACYGEALAYWTYVYWGAWGIGFTGALYYGSTAILFCWIAKLLTSWAYWAACWAYAMMAVMSTPWPWSCACSMSVRSFWFKMSST